MASTTADLLSTPPVSLVAAISPSPAVAAQALFRAQQSLIAYSVEDSGRSWCSADVLLSSYLSSRQNEMSSAPLTEKASLMAQRRSSVIPRELKYQVFLDLSN